MRNEGHFGANEAVSLIGVIVIGKIFYTSVSTLIGLVGTAAWMEVLLSMVTAIVASLPAFLLIKRFEGQSFDTIVVKVMGKWIGKLILLIFAVYLVYYAATNLREFVEMIKVYTLPKTGYSLIVIPFIIVVLFLAYHGLEVLARIAGIGFYAVMIAIVLIVLLSIPDANFEEICPLFGYGVKELVTVGVTRSSAFTEVILLIFIANVIRGKGMAHKVALRVLLIAGFTFSAILVVYISVFNEAYGAEQVSGMFQLAKSIYFNRYLQRTEAIYIFPWVLSSLLTVAVALYFSTKIYCSVFDMKAYRPILLPVLAIIYVVSSLPISFSNLVEVNLYIIRTMSGIWMYGLPALVWVVALIRRMGGKNIAKNS